MSASPGIDACLRPVALALPALDPSSQGPAPRLRPWSRTWRYLAAAGIGATSWVLVAVDYLPEDVGGIEAPVPDLAGGLLLIDLTVGLLALCLLPLRRRRPVLVAALTAAGSAVSATCLGAASVGIVSMSTRRRWSGVAVVGAVWMAATVVYELLLRPLVPGVDVQPILVWLSWFLSMAAYGIWVATGFYVGARRELLASLRERAENAEREQALREEATRGAERTRIAREMHDVLAHRISLVAMHAGALTYRTDLSAEETTRTAGIIADNAHLALTELRQVLGVLRAGQSVGDEAEPPQPTLGDVPDLLAATEQAGTEVLVDRSALPPAVNELSETTSRTAYRILQEALTNARKHAAGQPVQLRLARSEDWLVIEVLNRLLPQSPSGLPGAGVGLTGLSERAALVGGSLAFGTLPDNSFLLRAWLPWR